MNWTLFIGIVITLLSILCTVLTKFDPYRLNILSFMIGVILIVCGVMNASGIGIFTIILGVFSFVFSILMYAKVVPGPWTFGVDFVTLVIWFEYLLNQILIPVALIYHGVTILW